jgi:hypothetical protein
MWHVLAMWHTWLATWLWVHTGTGNEPGSYYGFFSGFGSDLGEYTIAGSIVLGILHSFRVHNCEVHGCWRIRRHKTAAGHWVCRKHHPDDKLTANDVIDAHNAALECLGEDPRES